jgi:hypothetical protein
MLLVAVRGQHFVRRHIHLPTRTDSILGTAGCCGPRPEVGACARPSRGRAEGALGPLRAVGQRVARGEGRRRGIAPGAESTRLGTDSSCRGSTCASHRGQTCPAPVAAPQGLRCDVRLHAAHVWIVRCVHDALQAGPQAATGRLRPDALSLGSAKPSDARTGYPPECPGNPEYALHPAHSRSGVLSCRRCERIQADRPWQPRRRWKEPSAWRPSRRLPRPPLWHTLPLRAGSTCRRPSTASRWGMACPCQSMPSTGTACPAHMPEYSIEGGLCRVRNTRKQAHVHSTVSGRLLCPQRARRGGRGAPQSGMRSCLFNRRKRCHAHRGHGVAHGLADRNLTVSAV